MGDRERQESFRRSMEECCQIIRLFKGDLLTCLKDLEGQFDIIYVDACGTLPSARQLIRSKKIGYLFLYNKLVSPGALITNFSFLQELEHAGVANGSERVSVEHITTEYLQYRLWNTRHQDYGIYEMLREAKLDCKSVDENYGDFVTFQVIHSAYLYIPAYRVLSSEK